jgi:hypothetical protein
VRSESCARDLAGASGACVILVQRPRCFERKRNATHRQTNRGVGAAKNLFQSAR